MNTEFDYDLMMESVDEAQRLGKEMVLEEASYAENDGFWVGAATIDESMTKKQQLTFHNKEKFMRHANYLIKKGAAVIIVEGDFSSADSKRAYQDGDYTPLSVVWAVPVWSIRNGYQKEFYVDIA